MIAATGTFSGELSSSPGKVYHFFLGLECSHSSGMSRTSCSDGSDFSDVDYSLGMSSFYSDECASGGHFTVMSKISGEVDSSFVGKDSGFMGTSSGKSNPLTSESEGLKCTDSLEVLHSGGMGASFGS